MRKIACFLGIVGLALMAFAQTSGKEWLSGFVRQLNSAESLSATYTIQQIGGSGSETCKIDFAKPNRLRIDRPNETVVADGKTLVTYDKVNKTYFKQPQTEADLAKLMSAEDTTIWAGFFKADVFAKSSSKVLGVKNRKGMNLTSVEMPMDSAGRRVLTFYFDNGKIARQAEILINDPAGKATYVVDTKSVTIGAGASDDSNADALFTFVPPQGSREITLAEMNSDKWYEDLEEAKKVALATNRMMMIDFSTVW